MHCSFRSVCVCLTALAFLGSGGLAGTASCPVAHAADSTAVPAVILTGSEASPLERLAAKELRRYVYQTTGALLPTLSKADGVGAGPVILVAAKRQPVVRQLLAGNEDLLEVVDTLAAEQYLLKTTVWQGQPLVVVIGGDPPGTLYGAYRLAERFGVRYYLHGDVLPDRIRPFSVPHVDEQGKPLFDCRGIQPFHDFPEGPDWWDLDGYKAVIAQLPKLRMNFIGFHTYPEGGVGPEPLVWIGMPDDVNDDGTVRFSYPARHFTTANPTGSWGYRPMKTGDYSFGAARLFDADDFAPAYMRLPVLWNRMTTEQSNELFHRMGELLADAFTFARRLGVRTCVGTETPLVIPTPVRERLKARGLDPADPAVVQRVYEGMFRRIMRTGPLDYYWFWTPEGWTWQGTKQEQIDATIADLRAALAAAEAVDAPFTLATCGWVLGPHQDRALFDHLLPKEMPMSCINRQVGHAPVEPRFAAVKGRPKWAIPWLEDDPALNSPQLWAGHMRKDAADALGYGCTGLLGIHWRTRILGPNVAALAQAAWDQSAWNPALNPALAPVIDDAPEGPDGGRFAHFPGAEIADTDADPLYRHVRYDVRAYHFHVPPGTYRVVLKFCEPHYGERNRRIFGVKIQDKLVIDRLDIFATVGKNRALDYTFDNVQVTDGHLVIDFQYQLEYPCIAAIAIEGPVTRKINCGGPAWGQYRADWPAATSPRRDRFLPVADFYNDWAKTQFGPEAAEPIAKLFAKLDGFLPRPSNWVGGPGGINPDSRPWNEVKKQYAFVDQLAQLRPQIQGPGNLERFDFWLNQFRYMRASAEVRCTWGRYNAALAKVKAEERPEKRKQAARQMLLPLRREIIEQLAEVHAYLLASVTTTGLMGNVSNWQQHILPMLLDEPGKELEKLLGEPLPDDCRPLRKYPGPRRIVVPTVRTCLEAGEPLRLKLIVLGGSVNPTLYWRPLGQGEFRSTAWKHLERSTYTFELPAAEITGDFEYYIEAEYQLPAEGGDGTAWLRFPATAPAVNQAVVILPREGAGR